MLRIGQGYDTHSFVLNKPLILGGVHIPHARGMKAHSDGDVLYHAVCDALLGAAALGDIGQHFPDTDSQYENLDSRVFLRHIMTLITAKNYVVSNVDTTILAQVPKLAPFIEQMRVNLAVDLKIDINQVNVKATTTERMGFVGREEGIACYAVVLLLGRNLVIA